jgi:hypothetical protein
MSSVAGDVDADSFVGELAGVDLHADGDDESLAPPRRLLRCECILSKRTSRFLLVVETVQDANNYQAILRTADAFGVQHVWIVESGVKRKHEEKQTNDDHAIVDATSSSAPTAAPPTPATTPQQHDATGTVSMGAGRWLTLRHFASTSSCIAALRADNREIWVTALSPSCVRLDRSLAPLPARLAIVLGRELDGVSAEMIAASAKQVFLPMIGFSESFNVSVAGALVCQRLFDLCEEAEGDMTEEERSHVRATWYKNLSLATPGSEADYMEHWLPRSARVVAAMHAAVATEGEAAILRPLEETRMPKVNAKVRRRMEAEGQRSVIVDSTTKANVSSVLSPKQ